MTKIAWTIKKIKYGLELFRIENKRYPTATEIDEYPYLPSARQIQRRFGGLVELRRSLKLSGQDDYTKGVHSSLRSKTINTRAHEKEKEIYKYLCEKFGVPFVHREHFFTDDHRARTDFFIHCKDKNFSVDVFYPSNIHNLVSCLNSKMKTYGDRLMLQYPVIFLMLNKKISETDIERMIERKKNRLKPYQSLMTLAEFMRFCESKKPYILE